MNKIIFSIAVSTILLSSSFLSGKPYNQPKFNPQRICEALVRGDLDAALSLTQQGIDSALVELEMLKKTINKPSDLINTVALAEAYTGALLIAKAEVLALKGDFKNAELAIVDAEKFDQQYPGSSMNGMLSEMSLPTAKAFILEKKGDLYAASKAYKAIISTAKQKGWSNNFRVIRGRLARIEFLNGDDSLAEKWSLDALQIDPGANLVMGELLEKKGNKAEARGYYVTALNLMDGAAKANNWSLPIYFADYRLAKELLVK